MPVPAKRKKPTGALYARLTGIVLLGGDREVPTEFRIFKAGANPSEKGTFTFDEQSALSVMEEYAAHNKPMLLDYNHGTTLEASTPEQALSAGEFVPEVRNGELWATGIKWTERAFGLLKGGEYRLFSPYFKHDKDGRVERLINVALTNLPALDGIPALVAADAKTPTEDDDMTCESCSALTSRLSAKEEECKALKEKLGFFEEKKKEDDTKATALTATVTSLTVLTGQASQAAALGVAEAWKAKAAGYDKLVADNAEKEAVSLRAELSSVLDKVVDELKLKPAIRDAEEKGALAFGGGKPSREGIDWLTAKYASMGPQVNTERSTPAAGSGFVLSETRRAIALQKGKKIEDVVAYETKRLSASTP